jgi:phosphotransferase system  glucose/maltose/N-acetylglucosamine-specific IIC component
MPPAIILDTAERSDDLSCYNVRFCVNSIIYFSQVTQTFLLSSVKVSLVEPLNRHEWSTYIKLITLAIFTIYAIILYWRWNQRNVVENRLR